MRLHDLLARSAQFHPHVQAVEDATRSVSYAELQHEANAMAMGLARLGIRAGDRCAILARNRIEYVAFYFATAQLGAVAVPLNWRLGARELEYIVRDSQARVVVAEPDFVSTLDAIAPGLPHLRHLVALDDAAPGWLPIDRLSETTMLAPGADGDRAAVGRDGAAIQMYTSGTTGLPKGAILTHRNVIALTESWLHDMPLTPRTDRFLQVTPLFHVGAVLMVMSNVAMGSRLLLLSEFAPGAAAEALTGRGVTKALFVPAMLRWLLAEPGVSGSAFPDLRMIVYGAAPIPPPLLEQAIGVFGCDFLQGYGLTETAGVLTTLRPEDHLVTAAGAGRLASAGRAVLCSRVRVVDEADRPVPAGVVGELVAQGDNITPGYWNLPEATQEALRGGWFHTGDAAWMDDEGFVTMVDRVKDMVLVGGENVYPREIEDALATHPGVTEAAVIGIPHDTWGEEVLALVVRRTGSQVTDRELIRHCRDRLARYKCPTRVEFIDIIPRNVAGKVVKRQLREPYWAGRDRRV